MEKIYFVIYFNSVVHRYIYADLHVWINLYYAQASLARTDDDDFGGCKIHPALRLAVHVSIVKTHVVYSSFMDISTLTTWILHYRHEKAF